MFIYPATAADAQGIADIFNQYLGIATMVLAPRPAADYAAIINTDRAAAFVAKDEDGRLTGFAYVKPYSDRGGYALAAEITVFLAPDQRGKKIGVYLYDELLPVAHELGYRHLTAKIWANNAASIRFHEKFGFRMVGTQVGIGLVNGKRVDTVIMERVW